MEKPKLDWNTFSLRRRLDIKAWLKSTKLKNYEDLKKWCESKDMIPPSRDEINKCFETQMEVKKVLKKEISEEVVHSESEEKVVPKTRKRRVAKALVDAKE